MTQDNRPVNLDFDLPAQPQSLVKLAALLREDDINLNAISALIEADMSFAAAVMKAVNSPLYGLKGRVQSVQQAVTYLGVREISAIAYEAGLQAAFPQVPQLVAVWERASIRGLLMGRLAQALSMEAWSAHTAGLFEECGKAVLYKHAPEQYAPMLAAARDDVHLVELERAAFGCGHDDVGANLCEAWGLTPAAVASVRGLLMGRLAQALSMEAWGAHTAGLFEECGKAVLYKHAPAVYAPMLAAAADDVALVELERQAFGVSHDEVGARLCDAWGLAPAAVASVRHHVGIQSSLRLPRVSHRYICVLSALAHTITNDPEQLDDVAMKLAPQAMLDQSSLLRGLHRVKDKIDEAIANG